MQKEKDICILDYIQTSTHSYGVCTCCSICMVCPQLEESMRINYTYVLYIKYILVHTINTKKYSNLWDTYVAK